MRKAQTTEKFKSTEKGLLKVMKEISKNFLKTLKKVLTNENECDIIIHALLREVR